MSSLTKLITVVLLGSIIGIAAVFYLIKPSLNRVAQLNMELTEKKTETKTLEQQILAYKSAQSDLSKATQRDRISNAFPAREELTLPIIHLEESALASGVVHSLSIDDVLSAPPGRAPVIPEVIPGKRLLKEIPYTIGVEGNFAGLISFLKRMEHSPYFTELTELQLSSQTPGAAQLNGDLRGIFIIKNNETVQ